MFVLLECFDTYCLLKGCVYVGVWCLVLLVNLF